MKNEVHCFVVILIIALRVWGCSFLSEALARRFWLRRCAASVDHQNYELGKALWTFFPVLSIRIFFEMLTITFSFYHNVDHHTWVIEKNLGPLVHHCFYMPSSYFSKKCINKMKSFFPRKIKIFHRKESPWIFWSLQRAPTLTVVALLTTAPTKKSNFSAIFEVFYIQILR